MKKKLLVSYCRTVAICMAVSILFEIIFPEKGFTAQFWISNFVSAIVMSAGLVALFDLMNGGGQKITTETYAEKQAKKKLVSQQ